MAPLPDLRSLIETVRAEARSDAPLDQLVQAAKSANAIEELSDGLLGHFVESCRASGCSWSEISAALGVTRQAAHKRFAEVGRNLGAVAPTFARFSERARAVIQEAARQARGLGASLVGTEHLLLGLFEPAEGLAAQVLRELGLSRQAVEERLAALSASFRRAAAESFGGAGEARSAGDAGDVAAGAAGAAAEGADRAGPAGGTIGLSPRAIQTLRHAVEEALKLGHNYIGTEHLLLGLLDEPDSLASRALSSLDVDYESARRRLSEKFEACRRAKEEGAR